MDRSFGDVVLVPFPFTNQSGAKKRPAVIVSSSGYNASRRDLVIMAITSQVRAPLGFALSKLDNYLDRPEMAGSAISGMMPESGHRKNLPAR